MEPIIAAKERLAFPLRAEATLRSLTEEILQSNEIEGEHLNKEQVRSSVARRLGIDIGAPALTDRNVDGVVEMTLDATQKYDEPLTKPRLFRWHAFSISESESIRFGYNIGGILVWYAGCLYSQHGTLSSSGTVQGRATIGGRGARAD